MPDTQPQSHLAASDQRWLVLFVHDLRKPLARLISTLHLLNDMLTASDTDGLDLVTDIAVECGEDIIKMLHAMPFNQSSSSPHMACELAPSVDRVLAIFNESAQSAGVTLVAQLPIKLPLLNIEHNQLLLVLRNLVDNAVRYAPNSRVEVLTAPALIVANGRPCLQIGVRDGGAGLDAALAQRAFDYFFRAPQNPNAPIGYGLGLPFCKWIVERHGGSIWVESSVGSGCTFWFTVPIYEQEVNL